MPTVKKATTQSRSLRNIQSSKSVPSEDVNISIAPSSTSTTRSSSLSVPVYSLAGRAAGTMALPKEIFGVEVKKSLLNQALRVYQTNQKIMSASTKTRGKVRGSTAKVWRQKGTGRARHGARTAPIFVGGGVTFGPQPRVVRLDLPKKMRRAALVSALSFKMGENKILGISGIEKTTGKTKEMIRLLGKLKIKNALFVTEKKQDNVVRGVRNIPGIDVLPGSQINAYEVLRHQMILLAKDSLATLSNDKKETSK